MNTFFVSIDPASASSAVNTAVVNGSVTGVLIDYYELREPNGYLAVMVFEKHYYRAGNRLTLTVTIDNLSGRTRVHTVSGGGGQGLFRFDWGAAGSFEGVVTNALNPYIIT